MRGILSFIFPVSHNFRITPACAGNTIGIDPGHGGAEDHPRVCGEYSPKYNHTNTCRGSPPRVRGIPLTFHSSVLGYGITPACAGNTPTLRGRQRLKRDHPRVCGEYRSEFRRRKWVTGSPPRVRGILMPFRSSADGSGITPACAGNTYGGLYPSMIWRDHPRVCGEYLQTPDKQQLYVGSPPRVRGILRKIIKGEKKMGITPACAGNTGL